MTARGKIRTQDLAAQSSKPDALPTELSQPANPHQSYFGISYDPAKCTDLAIIKTITYQISNYLSIFLSI